MTRYQKKRQVISLLTLILFMVSGCRMAAIGEPSPFEGATEVIVSTGESEAAGTVIKEQAAQTTILKSVAEQTISSTTQPPSNVQIKWDNLLVGPRHFQESVWDALNSEAKQLILDMAFGGFSNLSELTQAMPFDERVVGVEDYQPVRYLYDEGIEIHVDSDNKPQIYLADGIKGSIRHLADLFRLPMIDIDTHALPDISKAIIFGSDLLFLNNNNQVVKEVKVSPDCVKMMVKDVVGDDKCELILAYDMTTGGMDHDVVYLLVQGEVTPYDFSDLAEGIQMSQDATLQNKHFRIIDKWSDKDVSSLLPDKLFLNRKVLTDTTPCLYRTIHTKVNPETQRLEMVCSWYYEVSEMAEVLLARYTYGFETMSTDKLELRHVYAKYSDESPNQSTFNLKEIVIYENGKPVFNAGDSEQIIKTYLTSHVKDYGITFGRSYYDDTSIEKFELDSRIEISHPRFRILDDLHVGMTVNDLRKRLGPEDDSSPNGLTYYGISMPDWGFMYYYFQMECLMFELDEKDKEKIAKITLYNFYGD